MTTATDWPCSSCGAVKGAPCRSGTDRPRSPHEPRLALLRESRVIEEKLRKIGVDVEALKSDPVQYLLDLVSEEKEDRHG